MEILKIILIEQRIQLEQTVAQNTQSRHLMIYRVINVILRDRLRIVVTVHHLVLSRSMGIRSCFIGSAIHQQTIDHSNTKWCTLITKILAYKDHFYDHTSIQYNSSSTNAHNGHVCTVSRQYLSETLVHVLVIQITYCEETRGT